MRLHLPAHQLQVTRPTSTIAPEEPVNEGTARNANTCALGAVWWEGGAQKPPRTFPSNSGGWITVFTGGYGGNWQRQGSGGQRISVSITAHNPSRSCFHAPHRLREGMMALGCCNITHTLQIRQSTAKVGARGSHRTTTVAPEAAYSRGLWSRADCLIESKTGRGSNIASSCVTF